MSSSLKSILILVAKIGALTMVLMVLSGIGSTMLPASAQVEPSAEAVDSTSAPQPSGNFMALVLTIMGLQVVALAVPIVRSNWRGWRLIAMIFVLHFGTVTFLSQIESLVYLGDKMDSALIYGLFLMGFFVAAVFAPIAVVVLGKWKRSQDPGTESASLPHVDGLSWRFLAAGGVFLSLYYLFGYYVAWKNPELRAYYQGTDPGSFIAQMVSVVQGTPWMVPLQFVRGLVWVGLGLLVIRSMEGPWWQVGMALGLLFGVPTIYLLLPNPVMPDAIRMIHLVETLPYQFLFGLFLGWLFRERSRSVAHPAAVPA